MCWKRETQLRGDPSEHVLEQMTVSAEHRAFFEHDLKLWSLLWVPLLAGFEPLGALTSVRHRMLLPFNELDIAAAEELGKRMGLALSDAV